MRNVLIWFFGPALVALYFITLAGLLAPLHPIFDVINNLRLHVLETAVAMVILFAFMRVRQLALAAFFLALINLVLAAPAYVLTAVVPDEGRVLKVITLNAWGKNGDPDLIEAFLRREDADIVLIQEAGASLAPALAQLREIYPHRVDCMQEQLCRLALLSKHEISQPRTVLRSEGQPPMLSAQFNIDGLSFTFFGVHLARPFHANLQRLDIDALIAALNANRGPLIVAGDFNATPWSWAMMRLTVATGMVRGRAWGATWPTPSAQFLIDHVLVRGGIGIVDVRSARAVGSDHLPAIARISLR